MKLQSDLFEEEMPEISIHKPIRLIELFAGMGTQIQALKRLGVNVQSHFVCEFDKYAIAVYNSMHNSDFPTTDINNVKGGDLNVKECDKYCYVLTYSFP